MQTHRDDDHVDEKTSRANGGNPPDKDGLLGELRERAEEMTAAGENLVTAGAPGEKPIEEAQIGDILIRRMPDDPNHVTRVSMGMVRADGGYLVFRGDPRLVHDLLGKAKAALEESRMVMPHGWAPAKQK